MKTEVKLTPVELFFLGTQMHAKYIDYNYIAAMPDIQKRYALQEQRALEALEQRGIIEEDFGGNVELDEAIREVLEPVFFGEVESRLDAEQSYNIHLHNGKITIAVLEKDILRFFLAEEEDIGKLLKGDAVTIQCAKAGKGFCKKMFTSEELEQDSIKNEVIKFLKGECENGIS